MLKKLTELNGVSGNEKNVRDYIISYAKNFVDEITTDSIGNLILYKKGNKVNHNKVMLTSHMDEVGFIVSKVEENGFLRFKTVGGIDDRILLSHKVMVGENNIPGVIGIKAIHLLEKDERKKVVKAEDMYIDIGAKSKDDALKNVQIGDYISFDSEYVEFGNNDMFIKAKALDDRIGCMLMLELIKQETDSDIYFCFSVQEEVGLRGATVLSNKINPDVAIVLEATTASDVADTKPYEYTTCLGKGPAISIMDRASYSNKNLNKFITDIAEKTNIKYQYKKTIFGGNDAGAISTSGDGCETAVISVPCRYIHSPACVSHKEDIENTKKLITAILNNISAYNPVTQEVIK